MGMRFPFNKAEIFWLILASHQPNVKAIGRQGHLQIIFFVKHWPSVYYGYFKMRFYYEDSPRFDEQAFLGIWDSPVWDIHLSSEAFILTQWSIFVVISRSLISPILT